MLRNREINLTPQENAHKPLIPNYLDSEECQKIKLKQKEE
jgi:hypothetical protein